MGQSDLSQIWSLIHHPPLSVMTRIREAIECLWKWHSLTTLDLSSSIGKGMVRLVDSWFQSQLDQLYNNIDGLMEMTDIYKFMEEDIQQRMRKQYGAESAEISTWLTMMKAILSHQHRQIAIQLTQHNDLHSDDQGVPSRWMAIVIPPLTQQSPRIHSAFKGPWLLGIAEGLLSLASRLEQGDKAILTVHLIIRMTMNNTETCEDGDAVRQLALDICAREGPPNPNGNYAERAEELYQKLGKSLKFD